MACQRDREEAGADGGESGKKKMRWEGAQEQICRVLGL